MSDDTNNTFRLKVESMLYDVLKREEITKLDIKELAEEVVKNRELTAKDVDAMKKAINDSIEVIIANKQNELMSRVYKTLGIVLTVFTVLLALIQFLAS